MLSPIRNSPLLTQASVGADDGGKLGAKDGEAVVGVEDGEIVGVQDGEIVGNIDGVLLGAPLGVVEGAKDIGTLHSSHATGQAFSTICPFLNKPQFMIALGFGLCAIHAQVLAFPKKSSKVYDKISRQQSPHDTGQLICTSAFPHSNFRRTSIFLNQLHDLFSSLSIWKSSLFKQVLVGVKVGCTDGDMDGL